MKLDQDAKAGRDHEGLRMSGKGGRRGRLAHVAWKLEGKKEGWLEEEGQREITRVKIV